MRAQPLADVHRRLLARREIDDDRVRGAGADDAHRLRLACRERDVIPRDRERVPECLGPARDGLDDEEAGLQVSVHAALPFEYVGTRKKAWLNARCVEVDATV